MKMVDMHMHTRYSDGRNELWEMVEEASSLGLKEIAITDHVWRDSDWFEEYCLDIEECIERYGMKIHIGFEAKALSTRGEIDASGVMCEKAGVRLGAVHRIPKGEEKYRYLTREEVETEPSLAYRNWFSTTCGLIENPDVDIVAHPCFAPMKYGLQVDRRDIEKLFEMALEYGKRLEISYRYGDCNLPLLEAVKRNPVFLQVLGFGSDSHGVEELREAFGVVGR